MEKLLMNGLDKVKETRIMKDFNIQNIKNK